MAIFFPEQEMLEELEHDAIERRTRENRDGRRRREGPLADAFMLRVSTRSFSIWSRFFSLR